MIKVTGLNELAQCIAYSEIIREHEARAKREAVNTRKKQMIAEGVDKELASVMSKIFTEYGI